jgi:hypothetical protein
MKTLAIRLEDEQHARLTILAKLSEVSLTDAIREAIDAYLAKLSADPELSAKAEAFTAAIDREAAEQRDAIAALFGTTKPASSRSRQAKG